MAYSYTAINAEQCALKLSTLHDVRKACNDNLYSPPSGREKKKIIITT